MSHEETASELMGLMEEHKIVDNLESIRNRHSAYHAQLSKSVQPLLFLVIEVKAFSLESIKIVQAVTVRHLTKLWPSYFSDVLNSSSCSVVSCIVQI